MTIGVGGSTPKAEIERLSDMTAGVTPIGLEEFNGRIAKAQRLMLEHRIDAIYVNAGTNLYYYTGTRWCPSERMVGAIIPAVGGVVYIAPAFEVGTLGEYMQVSGTVYGWHEHESPYLLFGQVLRELGVATGVVGLDESAAFFLTEGIRQASPGFEYVNASAITAACRRVKSDAEIALLQRAKAITLEVHQRAASILAPGISTTEVKDFIHKAHQAAGIEAGSSFCIVLFGGATAYPHGVKNPQFLREGDMVLIDTGCRMFGYHSDITRTYVYGRPNARQRRVWNAEKAAQAAAFESAVIGRPCGAVDQAARRSLEAQGFGPGYKLPGLPHRTGHGIGLDVHEGPYLVSSDRTPLASGMCFSNEPMICIPGEFGVRLEDHFYMTEAGPRWFTEPAHSIDDPFGLNSPT